MDDYDVPHTEHPDKRDRPHDVASLLVMKAEWPDLKTICVAQGATLLGVKPLPVMDAFDVEVLCSTPERKLELYLAWIDYSNASPHRPRPWED
jgi:hypothetical protein